ncbi:hypothetical protein AAG906_025549 [Vitis piasezkii]
MDEGKVQVIKKWPIPSKVTELRSFLGLANYYRSMQCQMAFEGLKEAISTEPVLHLLDLDLPFKVQMDASNRALGGVLVQEGHPMVFEMVDALSRKEVIAYISTFSKVISNFNERIKGGVIKRYWLEEYLLMAQGGRWYVPTSGLRRELLRETHDAKWASHPDEKRTLALLVKSYYWLKIGEDVQAYVKILSSLSDGQD